MSEGYSLTREYEQKILDWVREKAGEGVAILKKEPAFNDIRTCVEFVNGEQVTLEKKALSSIHDNKLRKVVLETISALTDVRPIWNYETTNEEFKPQAEILNKLARGWWKKNKGDRALQSILTYSCVGGSGYGYLQWNEELQDLELLAVDPRDVIPIDPVVSDSVQDWSGVIIRKRHPLEQLKAQYPTKAHLLDSAAGMDWFGIDSGRGGKITSMIRSTFDIIRGGSTPRANGTLGVDVLRVFIKDRITMNTGDVPVEMGDPDSNWSYVVYPLGSINPQTGEKVTREQALLYPRGRLIVCTPSCILSDGPNPYWFGGFPLIQFTLDRLPWSLLGASMVADLIPLQKSLNDTLRGMDDAVSQWARRGVVGDQGALSKENLDRIDTRRGGLKVRINATMGEGFKVIEGPQLPGFFLEYPQFLKDEIDSNSGVLGLQQLAQMKQMPAADTMEQYKEALSPLLKLRSRSIEISLSELAEMLKVGFFQYYDAPRRMQIIGQDGISMEDFDYDPGTMVPEGDQPRDKRAEEHFGKFTFSIAPNSFLSVSHTTQKMMIMQLFRANGIDIWSMWDAMDLIDIGQKPAETIPERMEWAHQRGLQAGPTADVAAAQAQAAVAMAQAQVAQAQMMIQQSQQQPVGPVDSTGQGQPPSGGGGQPSGPSNNGVGSQGGRPPSGGQPPQFVQKTGPDGSQRTVVSESGS